MTQKIVQITFIALFSLILCGYKDTAATTGNSGKNFMLPKTFKINDAFLPPLDLKPEPKKINTEIETSINTKAKTKTPVIEKTTKPIVKVYTIQPPLPEKNTNTAKTVIPSSPIKNQTVKFNSVKTVSYLKPNSTISLNNLIKNYEYSYSDTLKSTIIALSAMEIAPVSFNTEKGQIIAQLNSGKEIFILLVPLKENNTFLRITPVDGNYNFPLATINELFVAINNNLNSI